MIQPISKTREIKAKLKKEGRISYLDQEAHITAILSMNIQMERVRQTYIYKNYNSERQAANILLY